MNFFKKHTLTRSICILLTLALFCPDISAAFTSYSNVKQNLATQTVSQQDMMTAKAEIFKNSILSDKDLFGSILTIERYLAGDPEKDIAPLPPEFLDYTMTAELKESLKNIDTSRVRFQDGSVIIRYRKDNTSCDIEVTPRENIADMSEYHIPTENHALKIIPCSDDDIAGETDLRTIAEMQEGLRNDPGVSRHGVMLFKMGIPEPVRKRTIRYLHEKGIDAARVGRVDGAIGMDTMLLRWGKGAGIEFSVNTIEDDGVPVTEAREAMETCDGKKFMAWFNSIYSNKKYSDLPSVKELKYFIECFDRDIEMVIVRSRVSRKELARNFGIEYTEEFEKMSFQDFFKKYIVGKTNSFEADPGSLRGHIIGPALSGKNGELRDLYARGTELGIPHKTIGLIATGIHCPKSGPEIDKEINDYLVPQKPALSELNNPRARMENTANYMIDLLHKEDGQNKYMKKVDRTETTYEMKRSLEEALDRFSHLEKYLAEQTDNITDIPEDLREAARYLRENMDKFEINSFLSALTVLARKAKRENQTLIIGLETIWIPGLEIDRSMQQNIFAPLIRVIENMNEDLKAMGIDVIIVSGTKDTLANDLLKTAENKNTDLSNMVVLASKESIESPSFNPLRSSPENVRAFLAGVDARKLLKHYNRHGQDIKKQLDIEIIEIFNVTLELAAGKPHRDIPLINSYDMDSRTVIFLPAIEPAEYNELIDKNHNKKKVLQAA